MEKNEKKEYSPNYYAILPANVRYDKKLNSTEKLLYAEITSLCDKEGYCWANNKYFADILGISTDWVSKVLSKMSAKGYVSIEIEKNGSGTFRKIFVGGEPKLVKGMIREKDVCGSLGDLNPPYPPSKGVVGIVVDDGGIGVKDEGDRSKTLAGVGVKHGRDRSKTLPKRTIQRTIQNNIKEKNKKEKENFLDFAETFGKNPPYPPSQGGVERDFTGGVDMASQGGVGMASQGGVGMASKGGSERSSKGSVGMASKVWSERSLQGVSDSSLQGGDNMALQMEADKVLQCVNGGAGRDKFVKPTVGEVAEYCAERNNGIDAEAFVAFYESKGWLIGKQPMKNWRAAIITWEKRNSKKVINDDNSI